LPVLLPLHAGRATSHQKHLPCWLVPGPVPVVGLLQPVVWLEHVALALRELDVQLHGAEPSVPVWQQALLAGVAVPPVPGAGDVSGQQVGPALHESQVFFYLHQ